MLNAGDKSKRFVTPRWNASRESRASKAVRGNDGVRSIQALIAQQKAKT
jgi:hypothetical protein